MTCGGNSHRSKTYFSSPQSKIGNKYLSKVRTAGSTRYIDVSRGDVIIEIVRRSGMAMEDNACIHYTGKQLDFSKLQSQRHCSTEKRVLDLGAGDK